MEKGEEVMYKVEKNVPMPNRVRNRKVKYPLDHMKIGDSFLIPFTKEKNHPKLIAVPYTMARRKGMEITCRGEKNGVRIWRVQ